MTVCRVFSKSNFMKREFIRPFKKSVYRARRNQLMKSLQRRSKRFVAIFWSGAEVKRNHDCFYRFRAHSDFLYLTGFNEPETALILSSDGARLKSVLALRKRDLGTQRGSEIWEGERMGVERAKEMAGVDEAFDVHELSARLPELLAHANTLYWRWGEFCDIDSKIMAITRQIDEERTSGKKIDVMADPSFALHEMRKIKSKEEIAIMRQSAEIAAAGHVRAMKSIRPGQYEYEVQAETEREFYKRGATAPAYNSIVAAGANACTLHYHTNDMPIGRNDLLLMDAGAEYMGYASDITRCFPASGKFSPAQKTIYNLVLKAQEAAIKSVKPGVSWRKPHEVAVKVLTKGLIELKIIKKPVAQALKQGLWRAYMPHGTSHWLGLDVHDRGAVFDENDKPLKLKAGNVLTIEPGLYFKPDDRSVPKSFRGIGVRIEDDILVTSTGFDVLTKSCPKQIEDIEALRVPKL